MIEMSEKLTAKEMAKKVLESNKEPMTATEIYKKGKEMNLIWESSSDHPESVLNGIIIKEIKIKEADSEFIKVSSEPNKYALNTQEARDKAPSRETVNIRDAPTAKKIINLISKIEIKKLGITNEHEIELVIWGAICSRWPEWIKYRKLIGGRVCDIGLSDVAIEIKFIKSLSDKDRLVGQVLDYLKEVDEVVIIAIDPKDFLKNSPLDQFDNVFLKIIEG